MKVTVLLLIAISCFDIRTSAQTKEKDVAVFPSMIQLLATPDKFDGKNIVVFGFMDFDTEADLLFTSKDDYDNVILANALWIEASEEMYKAKALLNLKYVRIQGIFSAKPRGRFGSYVGAITKVGDCTPWSDPSHPAREQVKKHIQTPQ